MKLGQKDSAIVTARLVGQNGGQPMSGEQLVLLIDGVQERTTSTDGDGSVRFSFKVPAKAGARSLEVKFPGSRTGLPSSATAQATIAAADVSALAVEPLPAVKFGNGQAIVVSARLALPSGEPIPDAPLELYVDGSRVRQETTNAAGEAKLSFRRDLPEGKHDVEVKYPGVGTMLPASSTVELEVLPADAARLSVDPISPVKLGQNNDFNVVAHLADESGKPIAGESLELVVDGQSERNSSTDATGTARFAVRRPLAAGNHSIEVKFPGARGITPATGGARLYVAPADASDFTIEPIGTVRLGSDQPITAVVRLATAAGPVIGAPIELWIDDLRERQESTNADGVVRFTVRRQLTVGPHAMEVRFEGQRGIEARRSSAKFEVLPADAPGLKIDPIAPVKAGTDQPFLIVANLTTSDGQPVVGAPLELFVNDRREQQLPTGADGVARFSYRRQLMSGPHKVAITYAGGRGIQPSTAEATLEVLPLDAAILTVEPMPMLQVGQDQVVTAIARLMLPSNEPMPGAPLELWVNGVQERSRSTGIDGISRLSFRRELTAGTHKVEVKYGGSRKLQPVAVTTQLVVAPAKVDVLVIPPLAGVRFAVNGRVFTSGDNGVAVLEMDRIGSYRVEVLPWESPVPGIQAKFARWSDEVFVASRDVLVPSVAHLQAGFETSFETTLSYVDLESQPVGMERIESAVLSNSMGQQYTLRPGEPQWLPGGRVVRRASGLEETRIQYSVENVSIGGSNVVNGREQRFYLSPQLNFETRLLLYKAQLRVHDALFGTPFGSAILLQYPGGKVERHELVNGETAFASLPRGEYRLSVEGPGLAFPSPIALSKDQDVTLGVFSYVDMALIGLVLAALAVALLLIGRPRLLRVLRPAVVVLAKRRATAPAGLEARPVAATAELAAE